MQARNIQTATLLAGLLISSSAHAHIRLLKPASWIEEDGLGDPQKSGPCGPGSGDTMTETGEVTEFEAGETITVEWEETIAHSGFFRIAVAANRDELVDPDVEIDTFCNYTTPPPDGAHGNVLADNLFPREGFPAAESFTYDVKLPDEPCENCTLQLMQFMTNHTQPCIYYHCANIKIVPKGGSTEAGEGGGGGSTGGSGGMGAGGMGEAGMSMSTGGMNGTAGTLASGGMGAPAAAGTTATTAGTTGTAGTTAAAGSTAPVTMNPPLAGSSAAAPEEESKSCSIARAAGGSANAFSLYALGLVAVALLRRRAR